MFSRLKTFMGCSPKEFVAVAAGAGPQETCSGRGDCLNGTCLCEIRFSGDACTGINLPYHAGELMGSVGGLKEAHDDDIN